MDTLTECSSCRQFKPDNDFRIIKGKRWGKQCKLCLKVAIQAYRTTPEGRGQFLTTRRRANRKLKSEAMAAYGGVCACCGVHHLEFLTIEHGNNDGGEHRRRLGRRSGGSYFYRWLRDQGYPQDLGLAVLCLNCNFATYWGVCPHKRDNTHYS